MHNYVIATGQQTIPNLASDAVSLSNHKCGVIFWISFLTTFSNINLK